MIEKRNEAIKDWEAIRALGICFDDEMGCGGCPMFGKYSKDTEECRFSMAMDVIDLINRQKAEIEKLKETPKCIYAYDGETMEYCVEGPCSVEKTIEEIKSEARKEFAERLKVEIALNTRVSNEAYLDIDSDIDNLIEEMESEGK